MFRNQGSLPIIEIAVRLGELTLGESVYALNAEKERKQQETTETCEDTNVPADQQSFSG